MDFAVSIVAETARQNQNQNHNAVVIDSINSPEFSRAVPENAEISATPLRNSRLIEFHRPISQIYISR